MFNLMIQDIAITIKAFFDGIFMLFKNFIPFLKISKMLVTIIFGFILFSFCCALPYANLKISPQTALLLLIVLIALTVLIIRAAWRILFELAAIPILVRDIFENKPLKPSVEYIAQIDKFCKKFLYMLFIYSIAAVICILSGFMIKNLFFLDILPTFTASLISTIFGFWFINWALYDKSDPNKRLKEALLFSYKHISSVISIALAVFAVSIALCMPLNIVYNAYSPQELAANRIPVLILFNAVFILTLVLSYVYTAITANIFLNLEKK